jgi:hypothetical protein
MIEIKLSESEKKVIELLRDLKPYGKLEIAVNQDGTQLSVYLTNPVKEIIYTEKYLERKLYK